MNEKRSIISDMKKLLNKHERERLLYHKKQIDVKNKMNRCKNNHATLSYNLNNFYRKKYSIQDELNTLIRKRLNQLTMYVFPIQENIFTTTTINNQQHFDDDDDDDDDLNIQSINCDKSEALPLLDCAINDDDDFDDNNDSVVTIKCKNDYNKKKKYESNQTRKQQIIRYKIVDSWINLDENFEGSVLN